MRFTVLGSGGFIGSHLVNHLRKLSFECLTPSRDVDFASEANWGHLIYSVGVTADFRYRFYETVQAHICYLLKVIQNSRFESFLYLSSTRVYSGSETGKEDAEICVSSHRFEDAYNLSKLMGESICLFAQRPAVRVVRLSNVYGPDWKSQNFLSSIIRDAVEKGQVVLNTDFASEKDYVSVKDVSAILPIIASSGKYHLYNVASGVNVTNKRLLDVIQSFTGCNVLCSQDIRHIYFPPIDISRIQKEFDFSPEVVIDAIKHLVDDYRSSRK